VRRQRARKSRRRSVATRRQILPLQHAGNRPLTMFRRCLDSRRPCRCWQVEEEAVACRLDDTAAMFLDFRIGEFASDRLQSNEGALLVHAHQPRVARHISGENGGQPAFDASRGQGGAPQPRRPIRSSALRAYSNHEDEAWHSSFTKRRICPRRPGKIGRARDTQMLGPPSVKDVRRRLAQRPATACEAVGARRIAVWRRKFTPVPKPTPRQP